MAEKSIGALWSKEGKNGTYMTGTIELEEGQKVSIVIFSNDKGGVETRPDYRIFKQRPKGESRDDGQGDPF